MANKGEWSEIYVIIKLLAERKLYAADSNLERIDDVFYPIIKILRDHAEDDERIEYILNGNVKIENGKGDALGEIPTIEFVQIAKELYKGTAEGKGSFDIPEIKEFLEQIHLKHGKSKSKNKSDIKLVIHDLKTGIKPTVTFSIKSLIGKDSTLFNPQVGTNFIYKIEVPDGQKIDINAINKAAIDKSSNKKGKISLRIDALRELGCKINFQRIQSEKLHLNTLLIDSDLPKILSYMLLYKYEFSLRNTTDLLDKLQEMNPLNYDTKFEHPFYSYKVRGLLYDYALGMTPEEVWTGKYSATGGIIIVKEDGDLLCYHVYDKNVFQEYLINNTWIDQPGTGEDKNNPGNPRPKGQKGKNYFYGWIYEEAGELFIKLNLQIRFLSQNKKAKGKLPEKIDF